MKATIVAIGEVEHGGDVQFTVRQVEAVEGVESARPLRREDAYSYRFKVRHELGSPRKLHQALAEAGVCI